MVHPRNRFLYNRLFPKLLFLPLVLLFACPALEDTPKDTIRSTEFSPPQNLTVIPDKDPYSNKQIVLSWKAPAETGGSEISGYEIFRNGKSIAKVLNENPAGEPIPQSNSPLGPTNTLTYTDIDLELWIPYLYAIEASNRKGHTSPAARGTTILDPTNLPLDHKRPEIKATTTIPASVKYIYQGDYKSIAGSSQIALLTFESIPSIIGIGAEAFANNDLSSLTIPGSVQYLGLGAFKGNLKLSTVTLPKDLYNKINVGSAGLTEVFGDNPITYILTGEDVTRELILPSIESITGNSYQNQRLTKVEIPETVTSIEENAFKGNKLRSLHIPESVTAVGKSAFQGNNELSDVSLSKTLYEEIRKRPSGLAAVFGANTISYYYETEINYGDEKLNILAKDLIIADGVKEIDDNKYSGDRGRYLFRTERFAVNQNKHDQQAAFLTKVVLPDTVETIGKNAFHSNLIMEVKFPSSLKSIGGAAFFANPLRSAELPDGLETIGKKAFQQTALTSIVIPDSVTSIGQEAFRYATGLQTVTLGKGLKTIGVLAFYRCEIKELELPEGLITIKDSAFADAYLGTELVIPKSVETIGKGTFVYDSAGQSNIIKVTLTKTLYDKIINNDTLPKDKEGLPEDNGGLPGVFDNDNEITYQDHDGKRLNM